MREEKMMLGRKESARYLGTAADYVGGILTGLAIVLFVLLFVRTILGQEVDLGTLGVALGLLSVGLGASAAGMSIKSNRRYTDLLTTLDTKVTDLPRMFSEDILTAFGHQTVKAQSKASAQKRLDEDTKRVGYVRGKVYQTKDGNWGVAWGGEYPL